MVGMHWYIPICHSPIVFIEWIWFCGGRDTKVGSSLSVAGLWLCVCVSGGAVTKVGSYLSVAGLWFCVCVCVCVGGGGGGTKVGSSLSVAGPLGALRNDL